MNDNISDMFNRIYTGGMAGKEVVSFPSSKMIDSILEILRSEGYIESYKKINNKTFKDTEIKIKYEVDKDDLGIGESPKPVLKGFNRVSKLSQRVYVGYRDLKKNQQGKVALRILSTPKGVTTDMEALKNRVGGELVAEVW